MTALAGSATAAAAEPGGSPSPSAVGAASPTVGAPGAPAPSATASGTADPGASGAPGSGQATATATASPTAQPSCPAGDTGTPNATPTAGPSTSVAPSASPSPTPAAPSATARSANCRTTAPTPPAVPVASRGAAAPAGSARGHGRLRQSAPGGDEPTAVDVQLVDGVTPQTPEATAAPTPVNGQLASTFVTSIGGNAGLTAVGFGLLVASGGGALWLKRRIATKRDPETPSAN
ncbi:hypothetical protein [Kitasatospora acidiphila]|uniref:hypothetical protein n=2 Tax=Kitasatospora TaxID=2063 RepID=UPI003C70D6F0